MASRHGVLLAVVAATLAAGCATIPYGPSVPVMPAGGKTLSEFESDDYTCRRFAERQVGGLSPTGAAESSVAKSAVVGTAVGAAAGAAFGGGHGAAIGAGTGLLAGSMVGAGVASASAEEVQYRYDNAYAQCMTAQGNRVPHAGRTAALPPRHYDEPVYEEYVEEYVYEEPYEYCPEHHHHRHHRHHDHHDHWY